MPAPLSSSLRERIFSLVQQGFSSAAIADHLRLPPRTVRHLCQRFRQHGREALAPSYPPPQPPQPSPAVRQAIALHQQHPTWGAPYLRIQLQRLHPELTDVPSARTLQRWFRRHQQPPAPPGRKPESTTARAQRPHQVWQMDAVDQLPLQTGQHVSWLRWVDEYTGAVLGTVVFSLRLV